MVEKNKDFLYMYESEDKANPSNSLSNGQKGLELKVVASLKLDQFLFLFC